MVKFSSWDLSGRMRTLQGEYHGRRRNIFVCLIKDSKEGGLELGINVHKDNIGKYEFNGDSLDIWWSKEPIRKYVVMPATMYEVPEGMDINTINVYDKN